MSILPNVTPNWGGDVNIYSPAPDPNPFVKRQRVEEEFRAVKLTLKNFNSVVLQMLKCGTEAIYVPGDSSHIQWGTEHFKLDSWIVETCDKAFLVNKYRPATDEERVQYGLA